MGMHVVKQFAAMQLDNLRKKRIEIDRDIAELEKFLGVYHEQTTAHAEGTYTAEITAAICDVLSNAGTLLHRNEILTTLEEREFFVSGKDKLGALSAYLSRDERFTPVGKGKWGLTADINKSTDSEWSEPAQLVPYHSTNPMDGFTAIVLDEQGIGGNNAA